MTIRFKDSKLSFIEKRETNGKSDSTERKSVRPVFPNKSNDSSNSRATMGLNRKKYQKTVLKKVR